MAPSHNRSGLLKGVGVVSTLIDAASEFARGRRGSGLLLVGAAAVSSRVTGFGTAVSALLRLYRRLR